MAALAKLEAQQLAAALAQSLVTLDEAETTNGTSVTTSTNLHNQVHNTKNIKQNSAETVNTGKEKETSQQHSHSDSNNDDSDNSNSDDESPVSHFKKVSCKVILLQLKFSTSGRRII
jgi:hypothetical protein